MDVEWIWFYYDLGFSIIPLKQTKPPSDDNKKPNIKTWDQYKKNRATKTQIQEWIDQDLFQNIGVIGGSVSDNLVIIDIDDESIPELLDIKFDKILKSGAWPVKTGNGYQIYMKHHSNPGHLQKPLKYKIEYRANGGYCVAPPSIHPNGKQYHFIDIKNKKNLPRLQEKDVKSIFKKMKQKIGQAWNIKPKKQHNITGFTETDNTNGYPKCVEKALDTKTKHPMRYNTIYGIASSFYMQKIPIDMATKRIKQYNMEKCIPPKKPEDVENAIHGAYNPENKKYGCEFWMDDAELCPYENIMKCPYGNKKAKRELAQRYKIYKYKEIKKNDETKYIKTGVIYPRLAELILNEYDYNFITLKDTKEIYYYNDGRYHRKGETKIRTLSEEYMKELSSKHGKNEVEDHIRDKKYMNREIFNAPVHLINLKNGVYNLKTKKLNDHNPKHYFINEIPVEYKKNADCPKIKKFISEVIEEKNIPCLQEFIGYCLYRDYPIQKAFMFLGAGKNGKSTAINLITEFLGRENISNKELQKLTYDKFAKSKLFGKLLNAAADISSSGLEQTGVFKELTGGDYVDADKKFLESIEFKNYAKLMFSANTLPKAKDDSYAFYRRWVLINFPNTFKGKNCDPHILEKITTPDELSGLFNWALEGLERLLENNRFSYDKSTEEIREQYKTLSDPVFAFVQKYITTQSTGFLTKNEVYTKYCEWCKKHDLPVTPKNMFTMDLGKHIPNMQTGKSRVHGQLTPVYNYIGWKNIENSDNISHGKSAKNVGNPEHLDFFR